MRFDDIKLFFLVLVGVGWTSTAVAATNMHPMLSEIPWVQVAVGGMLALWGGLTRTAEQLLNALRTGAEFHVKAELVRDIIVSSGIGFLVYAAGALQAWNVWVLGAMLWCCGYLGTRFLAPYAEKKVSAWMPHRDPPV
jgi:phytoene dehydrogenase-like protein